MNKEIESQLVIYQDENWEVNVAVNIIRDSLVIFKSNSSTICTR
ncbi:hypothetical protein [Rickettsia oklahomensis]|uniref:Uncharacterized protein n=1 Tax=Rickettsia oklahomensis TaxID=3141789 RepID=A0AAU7BZK8_9RICK